MMNLATITSIAPISLIHELRVTGSAVTDTLTPPTGKSICIVGMILGNMYIPSSLTSTVGASLSFGTGGVSDISKIIWRGRLDAKMSSNGFTVSHIHLHGKVNEILRLTNITYSVGNATTRATIFYKWD